MLFSMPMGRDLWVYLAHGCSVQSGFDPYRALPRRTRTPHPLRGQRALAAHAFAVRTALDRDGPAGRRAHRPSFVVGTFLLRLAGIRRTARAELALYVLAGPVRAPRRSSGLAGAGQSAGRPSDGRRAQRPRPGRAGSRRGHRRGPPRRHLAGPGRWVGPHWAGRTDQVPGADRAGVSSCRSGSPHVARTTSVGLVVKAGAAAVGSAVRLGRGGGTALSGTRRSGGCARPARRTRSSNWQSLPTAGGHGRQCGAARGCSTRPT
jgi:hypothetical protein